MIKNIVGKRFGRLIVLTDSGQRKGRKVLWKCKCDCGNTIIVKSTQLTSGKTQSCGCFKDESRIKTHTTHGLFHKRLYKIWAGIKYRCLNKNSPEYMYYGGRGITICEEWSNNPDIFYKWAMENGYADNLSIDRIDNGKGYSPENCRWVDVKTQANNRRPRSVKKAS